MKYYIILLLFHQIFYIRTALPNWDISSQSISVDLTSEYRKTIYDKNGYDTRVKLERVIKKEDGIVISKNILTINTTTREVPFYDIESHYANKYGFNILICPKGNFHPYKFNENQYMIPDSFEQIRKWDLKCYDHYTNHFLIFYLQNGHYTFYTKCNNVCSDNNFKRLDYVLDIYDFTLENGNYDVANYQYKLPSLLKSGNYLKFYASVLTMNEGDHNVNKQDVGGYKTIIQTKNYTQAYFALNNYSNFYYFTYNTIDDFKSGYYETSVDTSNYNKGNAITITYHLDNENSPLSFTDNVEIDQINFIRGTKYVYYKIKNIDKNNYYYGLIDIKLNKVLYNFEEGNITFIPFSNDATMLAITSTSSYKLCIVKDGSSCNNTCSNIALDPEANKCQTLCDDGKIKLMPEGICISEALCDLTMYIIKNDDTEGKQCGLCSYFYSVDKYRLIGTNECRSTEPSHAIIHNAKLLLYKCETNYHIVDNECKPEFCFERCEECIEISDDVNDQKCSSCKSNYIYDSENRNCILPPTTIPVLPSTTIPLQPPTTIKNEPTTIIIETPITDCANKKCRECNRESNEVKLCLSCDETLYRKVNYTYRFNKFVDCLPPNKVQTKYYYDEIKQQYRPCYENCKLCSGPGNATVQNCLQCEDNYMFRPVNNPYNNCVVYSQFYYISPYNEYKPLNTPQCPEVAKYKVKNENNQTFCIYDCKEDKTYKYLYNGNCLKDCSEIEGTSNENYICKEIDITKTYISENPIYMDNTNNTISTIQTLAISYAEEFNYTVNHISLYKNDEMTVALYKNKSIISSTNLKLPNIEFGETYNKIKEAYNISQDLIIAIVEKKVNNNPTTLYLFFHPVSGIRLDVGELCKNDTIEVKENLLSMLDENSENYELQTALTKQGINIFDINDPYYKDICYDFDNPKKRDMALKDRIKETYVNVTLCDDGCINTGIDIKNNVATCNCKFNDVTNNDLIHENAAIEYLVGEFFDLVNSSNILVLKCYKNLLKYFTRSIGGILVLILLVLNIIFTLIFFLYELTKMKRYIFKLLEEFILFISRYPNLVKFYPPKRDNKKRKTEKTIDFSKQNLVENNNINNKRRKNKLNSNKSSKIISNININKPQINSKDLIVYNKIKNPNDISEEKDNDNGKTKNELNEGKKLKKYFKEYLSTNPDDMEYDEAIKLDKRTFCRYFLDSIEEKQSFAYTFIASDPINTRMIKFILFSLNINLYFVVNGLFFSEEFISELYHIDEKKENFFSFIPRTIDKIIYTTIVAIFIGYLTDFFFLNEDKIKGIFKREKDNKIILKRSIALLIKEIQKRYISFIIMTFVIFLFSLYYILCFNYVYPKTQIEWIKSSILIIIVLQIISILKCLFETIFRFLSFKCESEKLYKVSKIFDKN